MSFSLDEKWAEAKRFIASQGMENNWIEIMDYYRQIGGEHTAIFSAIEKNMYMILEVTKDNSVLVLDRNNKVIEMDYDLIYKSKKMFYYIEEPYTEVIEIPEELYLKSYSGNKEIKISKRKDVNVSG